MINIISPKFLSKPATHDSHVATTNCCVFCHPFWMACRSPSSAKRIVNLVYNHQCFSSPIEGSKVNKAASKPLRSRTRVVYSHVMRLPVPPRVPLPALSQVRTHTSLRCASRRRANRAAGGVAQALRKRQ